MEFIWLELDDISLSYSTSSLDIKIWGIAVESDIRAISVCDRDICASSIIKIGGSGCDPQIQLRVVSLSQSE
jgi:hypothetical protein